MQTHVFSIFGTLSGSPFLSECQALLRFGLDLLNVIKPAPVSLNYIFGKRKNSQGAKSGEYGGWGLADILFFARNCWVMTEV
jgi:hypothetical protein